MMIHLTKAAVEEIKRLQHSSQQLESYFRLGVKSGGCSGLYYTLELTSSPQKNDVVYQNQGIALVVASENQSYLQNLKLDYAEDLMGGGFRFHNPQATKTCSCGISFST